MEIHGVSSGRTKESAALTGMIVGFFDVAVTLAAVLVSNSSVLMADLLKTTLEFVAVLLGWIAVRRVAKGADHHFNFGIGKLENLSSLLVGILMICCVILITCAAIRNMIHPEHIAGLGIWISLASQVVYGVVNAIVFCRARRLADLTSSPLMRAQGRLFLTRFIGNVFILLSLVGSMWLSGYRWSMYIDPVASIMIALSIALSATNIFSSSFYDLLDRTLEETDQLAILREVAQHFFEYKDLHGIRSRRVGSSVFIEIFLEFDDDKTAADIQRVVSSMRSKIEASIPNSRATIGITDRREC